MPANLCDGAIEVIHQRGWCKHIRCDQRMRVCALGALDVAKLGIDFNHRCSPWLFYDFADKTPEACALAQVIREQFPDRLGNFLSSTGVIAAFNNHPDTVEEDVIRAFEKASVSL